MLRFIVLLQFPLFLLHLGECYYNAETLSDAFHIKSLYGEVGAGNFSYYQLSTSGTVYLKLITYDGDADLYASTTSLFPTWEDYTMKSDTCSVDVILIQPYDTRPVGIGVYGYISYDVSRYELHVYKDTTETDFFNQSNDFEDSSYNYKEEGRSNGLNMSNKEDESSISSFIINILLELLSIVIEVLL